MKDPVHRDCVLTISGLSLMAGIFVFAIYLPAHRACLRIRQEIAAAEQAVHEVPLRVAELDMLQQQLAKREKYLRQTATLFPEGASIHQVVQDIAHLARNSALEINRLEPLPPEQLQSYERLSFRVSFRGSFRALTTFCKGLESQTLLVAVDQIKLASESGVNAKGVQGDVVFSVYVKFNDFSKIAENSVQIRADSADIR
jgi:Tfp pilus assembly protein PilO